MFNFHVYIFLYKVFIKDLIKYSYRVFIRLAIYRFTPNFLNDSLNLYYNCFNIFNLFICFLGHIHSGYLYTFNKRAITGGLP